MKEMIKCPKCGSERITINGVEQRKKGALYYLSGTVFTDAGIRHSEMLRNAVKGNKENARCYACGYTWHAGKDAPAPAAAEPVPEPAPVPTVEKPAARPRFCRKCGGAIEPDDVFCVNCGTKL